MSHHLMMVGMGGSAEPRSITFDNGVTGALAANWVHTRNVASRDGLGVPVAANEPRYDAPALRIEPVAGTKTLAINDVSANQHIITGRDFNGIDDLCLHQLNTSNELKTYRNTLTTPILTNNLSAYGFDLMRDTVSGKRFKMAAGTICHGLIAVMARRQDGASNDQGVALLLSTDYGDNWTIALDGSSNQSLPDYDADHTRGTYFCLQNWFLPEGQDPDNPTAVWLVFTDYTFRGAPESTGGQTGLVYCTRSTGTSSDWVNHGCRLIYSQTGAAAGTHFHCAGVVHDGSILYVVTAVGDTPPRNMCVLSSMDLTAGPMGYMTEAITDNILFHGGRTADYANGNGLLGYQFTSIAPGPTARTLVATSDFNDESSALIKIPTGDRATVKAEISFLHGRRSSENFAVICRDPGNRTHFVSGDRQSGATKARCYYSPDGSNWADIAELTGGGVPQFGFFGGKILHVYPNLGVYEFDMPETQVQRPLLVGPGHKNRAGGTWAQWTAPEAGVTISTYAPNGSGLYEYPTGHPRAGEVMDKQPQSMCTVAVVETTGVNDDAGFRYITANNYDPFGGTDQSAIVEVFGVSGCGTEGRSIFDGALNNVQIGTAVNNDWMIYHQPGQLRSASANRPNFKWQFRSGTATTGPQKVLVTVSAHKEGADCAGYPVPPDTDASAIHTQASLDAVTLSADWSVTGWFGTPYFGQIQTANENPILSIVKGSDYVEVVKTAQDTVTLRVYVGAVLTTNTISVRLRAGDFGTFFKLIVSEAGGNTTLTWKGIEESSCVVAAAIGAGTANIKLSANNDFSKVGIHRVFKIELND